MDITRFSASEVRVLDKVKSEMEKAGCKDTVNKLYRQARVWNRFHYFFEGACDYVRYTQLNEALKQLRWDRIEVIKGLEDVQ